MSLRTLAMGPDARPVPGARPQPLAQREFRSASGKFSPEHSPRWIIYDSDETGKYEVFVQSFPDPAVKVQVSTGGGRSPRWGAGGREIFYDGNRRLMAVELKLTGNTVLPSEPRELFPLPEIGDLQSFDVTADGQKIFVMMPKEEPGRPLTVILNWTALLDRHGAPSN